MSQEHPKSKLNIISPPLQIEGFQEFEARRKKKVDKQIDSNVIISSNGLDVGVDHWHLCKGMCVRCYYYALYYVSWCVVLFPLQCLYISFQPLHFMPPRVKFFRNSGLGFVEGKENMSCMDEGCAKNFLDKWDASGSCMYILPRYSILIRWFYWSSCSWVNRRVCWRAALLAQP